MLEVAAFVFVTTFGVLAMFTEFKGKGTLRKVLTVLGIVLAAYAKVYETAGEGRFSLVELRPP